VLLTGEAVGNRKLFVVLHRYKQFFVMKKNTVDVRIGDVYGQLKILKQVVSITSGRRFLCECSCGVKKVFSLSNIRHKKNPACGCQRNAGKKRQQVVGNTFNKFTAINEVVAKGGRRYFQCICTCGSIKTVEMSNLVAGRSKSCGCLQKEIMQKRYAHSHHKSNTAIYRIWTLMLQRCENKNNPAYTRYGGRGIRVSRSWHSFVNFYRDMGEKPKGMTLDRIDNNLGYNKRNCRWATSLEQANNKRNNHLVHYAGQCRTLTEWSRKTGIKQETIRRRLKCGWSVERALDTT